MDPSPRPSPPTGILRSIGASRGGEGEKAATSAAGHDTWRLTTIRAGIAVYWLAMFLATHLPVQRVTEQLPTTDKHLHFGAYAVLGFALPWWSLRRAPWQQSMLLFGLVLTYAALDELLQIPVGRTAEFGDWLADAIGAAIGITLGSLTATRLCVRSAEVHTDGRTA